jgi:hypothetical protein
MDMLDPKSIYRYRWDFGMVGKTNDSEVVSERRGVYSLYRYRAGVLHSAVEGLDGPIVN